MIYPSSQQKHIIAVNDGASRFVYNRMTANDRELHSLKKAASLCPAYKGKIAYLEQVRSSKRELVNTIPFLKEKDVDSLAVDNAIKNHNRAWERFREVPGTGIPGFHKKSYAQSYQTNAHYKKGAESWEEGNVHFVRRSAGEQVPHFISLPILGAIRFRCSRLEGVFGRELEKIRTDIPWEYMLNHTVCDFAETVRWWMKNDEYSPEDISRFFFSTTPF